MRLLQIIEVILGTSSLTEALRLSSSNFGIPGVNRTFDYVVVGGGTSGATLATRLAQDGRYSVAVIEAGGFYETDNGNLSVVPGQATFHAGSDPDNTHPLTDWGFVTTPQAGAAGRSIHYARGKALGGSSVRSLLLYQRPTIGSMQQWADEVGDQSFTWSNTLPYFEKSVHFHIQDTTLRPNASNNQTSAGFTGSNPGPLHVSYGNYVNSYATWIRQALLKVGQKAVDGFNSGHLIGSAWVTWTIDPKNGQRSTSMSSFLQQAMAETTTLQIYTRSLAEKILFDGTTATGVLVNTAGSYGTPGVKYILNANREVIVAAGAFQSPQLLMVSGIGPKATLQANSIPIVKELPGVGQNMWDHNWWGPTFRVKLPTVSALFNDPNFANNAGYLYVHNGTGPLSEVNSGYFGWEKLTDIPGMAISQDAQDKLSRFSADWPQVEYFGVNAYFGYQRNYQTGDPIDGTNYAGIAASLAAPLSRGNVSINSPHMSDPPLISPNWLTDPADKELAIASFKRAREIFGELENMDITDGPEIIPGQDVQTDEQILDFIGKGLHTVWHGSATCKMGVASDIMAVVDSHARVFGIQKLRIVDASAFPFLPPGHPQSVVYMLAEKVADQILQGPAEKDGESGRGSMRVNDVLGSGQWYDGIWGR